MNSKRDKPSELGYNFAGSEKSSGNVCFEYFEYFLSKNAWIYYRLPFPSVRYDEYKFKNKKTKKVYDSQKGYLKYNFLCTTKI